jgi:16S rRNA (cytosine967-C5)-methyltransferase
VSGPVETRSLAAGVVGRVLRSGAYSNVLIDEATSDLSPRDRARAKALVFGVLRRLEPIDRSLEAASGREIGAFDNAVLDSLRVSVFEVLYGDLPRPVTVSTGVDLVRSVSPRAAGLANAVLRRVAAMETPTEQGLVLPPWLSEMLDRAWGVEERARFATASAGEPERVARSGDGGIEGYAGVRGAVALEPGPLPPRMTVQDAASIAVGNAVAAEPGMTVLDIAAAPGGKTLHLLEQVGAEGVVVALDRHQRRVRTAVGRVPGARWVVGDGVEPPFSPHSFDRVLLDAPCSGLGTLRRRPEIRLRVEETTVGQLAGLQRRLLSAAMGLVAPGGRLVYSVCTVTPAETIEVVAGLGMRPASGPGRVWGDGRLMGPHLTGTDGMFISVHQP